MLKRSFLAIAVILAFLVLFKLFMAEGHHSWAKENEYEITEIASHHSLLKEETIPKNPEDIQLPFVKSVRVFIQKNLHEVNWMDYDKEYGSQYSFKAKNGNGKVVCKARFSGDHLQGMVVEFREMESALIDSIKSQLNDVYPQYKIIWVDSL